MTTDVIHVLLADDHEVVRAGLKAAFRTRSEFSFVGEASNGKEAVRETKRLKPELAVLDVRMPVLGGIEACREIRSSVPETHVLMLTSFPDDKAVMAALMAGASGFMLKDVRTDALLDAMRIVGRGGSTLDPTTCAGVIEQIRRGNLLTDEDRIAQALNERELQVLDLIAEGLTNREMGERMFLSEKTIKHHVSDILSKLGLSRRVEAATFAIRHRAQHPPNES